MPDPLDQEGCEDFPVFEGEVVASEFDADGDADRLMDEIETGRAFEALGDGSEGNGRWVATGVAEAGMGFRDVEGWRFVRLAEVDDEDERHAYKHPDKDRGVQNRRVRECADDPMDDHRCCQGPDHHVTDTRPLQAGELPDRRRIGGHCNGSDGN